MQICSITAFLVLWWFSAICFSGLTISSTIFVENWRWTSPRLSISAAALRHASANVPGTSRHDLFNFIAIFDSDFAYNASESTLELIKNADVNANLYMYYYIRILSDIFPLLSLTYLSWRIATRSFPKSLPCLTYRRSSSNPFWPFRRKAEKIVSWIKKSAKKNFNLI